MPTYLNMLRNPGTLLRNNVYDGGGGGYPAGRRDDRIHWLTPERPQGGSFGTGTTPTGYSPWGSGAGGSGGYSGQGGIDAILRQLLSGGGTGATGSSPFGIGTQQGTAPTAGTMGVGGAPTAGVAGAPMVGGAGTAPTGSPPVGLPPPAGGAPAAPWRPAGAQGGVNSQMQRLAGMDAAGVDQLFSTAQDDGQRAAIYNALRAAGNPAATAWMQNRLGGREQEAQFSQYWNEANAGQLPVWDASTGQFMSQADSYARQMGWPTSGGALAGTGTPASNVPPTGGVYPQAPGGLGGSATGAPGGASAGVGTPATGGGDPVPGDMGGQFSWDPQASRELDVNAFLDPSMNFRIQQGTNALESSAAARGGLLSGATLRGVQDYSQNIASQEYNNAVNRAMQERGFQTGLDRDNRDFRYGAFRDDRDFNESGRRYENEFDYRARTGDRDFNYNRDRDNRNFGYGAQVGDREFNYRTLSDLARLGMGGAQGSAGMQQLLASLLNSNELSRGNVGAAGAIGQGNATNSMIQQLIQMMQQNAWRP